VARGQEQRRRILIAAGGTGGHIFPALAVLDVLLERHPDLVPAWIGSDDRMESKLVPSRGIEFHGLRQTGFRRNPTPANILYNTRSLWYLIAAIFRSIGIIRKLKPKFILATGGFAAGAAGLAAWLTGTAIALIEPNAYPGLTNRFLGKCAKVVFTAYPQAASHFPADRVHTTGVPARREIINKNRNEARESLGLDDATLMILGMGGSQGAAKINTILPQAVNLLKEQRGLDGMQIIHQCGKGKSSTVNIDPNTIPETHYKIIEFIDDTPTYIASADIVICRAGASTLSEIGCRGIPSIMIPLPISAENHQVKNALAWESAGASICLEEIKLNPDVLAGKISYLLDNPDKRSEMGSKARSLADPSASESIVDILERTVMK